MWGAHMNGVSLIGLVDRTRAAILDHDCDAALDAVDTIASYVANAAPAWSDFHDEVSAVAHEANRLYVEGATEAAVRELYGRLMIALAEVNDAAMLNRSWHAEALAER